MTTYVHIYRANEQPATRWKIDMGPGKRPLVVKNAPGRLLQCSHCYRIRRARNMVAYVYYDSTDYVCRLKEYGRSREFPFGYQTVCAGTAFRPRSK